MCKKICRKGKKGQVFVKIVQLLCLFATDLWLRLGKVNVPLALHKVSLRLTFGCTRQNEQALLHSLARKFYSSRRAVPPKQLTFPYTLLIIRARARAREKREGRGERGERREREREREGIDVKIVQVWGCFCAAEGAFHRLQGRFIGGRRDERAKVR